ncbi:hypothetical protein KO566_09385 [Flavobacteriaceae bacterium XHP0103]|uniref:hypothetical protein n=1 Tax=Marixanthotalea marina TaxID=2844359 RepID=UPI002989A6A2|nr:hypothetical protein [Marixanthotalea marina]MBU3822272.1 hypothetical protein [Marixanthotalea marina]
MTLLQRVGYYLGGFSIGLIILAFFLNGKKASCSYGPESRVIKNINSKRIVYSPDFEESMHQMNLDTLSINKALKRGDIDFSKSETRKEPCSVYYIEDTFDSSEISFLVENCDSIATLSNLTLKDD